MFIKCIDDGYQDIWVNERFVKNIQTAYYEDGSEGTHYLQTSENKVYEVRDPKLKEKLEAM